MMIQLASGEQEIGDPVAIYTVPSGKKAIILHMALTNTDTDNETDIHLSHLLDEVEVTLREVAILAADTIEFHGALTLPAGTVLQLDVETRGPIHYFVDGILEDE